MSIKPIGPRVLIKPIEEKEKKTEGGIYVPEEETENVKRGKVIAVGSKKIKSIKKGDKVIYKDLGAVEYKGNIIIKIDKIIAKL